MSFQEQVVSSHPKDGLQFSWSLDSSQASDVLVEYRKAQRPFQHLPGSTECVCSECTSTSKMFPAVIIFS